jgi:hypothetical protein
MFVRVICLHLIAISPLLVVHTLENLLTIMSLEKVSNIDLRDLIFSYDTYVVGFLVVFV